MNNHSHEHQMKPRNVRRGFYQKGFDVIGGQKDLNPQILKQLRKKLNKGPGADGTPVVLTDKGERMRAWSAFPNWGMNIVASHKVSVHRALPDGRPEGCKEREFKNEGQNASVVIVFHDEAWSALLRTVWSVLHTVPSELLHEVILVDDFSTRMHLRKKLDKYIKKHFPSIVKLKRLSERQGLIRARLVGARFAAAEYLVFLDSHNECADGWMEPLLHELSADQSAVAAPTMDVVDHDTMEYKAAVGFVPTGGFGWDASFRVIDIISQICLPLILFMYFDYSGSVRPFPPMLQRLCLPQFLAEEYLPWPESTFGRSVFIIGKFMRYINF